MSRGFENIAHALLAIVLVGGSLYALARYAGSGAPAAPTQAVQIPTPRNAPAPIPSAPLPVASLPRLGPAPAENVVRTATKTYYLTPVNPAQTDADTFNALRRNCYDAARNNSDGRYPALQQSACNNFADFARRKGWDTGALPAYGTLSPPPQEVAYQGENEPDNSAQATALYNGEQVIEVERRSEHRPPREKWLRERSAEMYGPKP